MTGDLVEGRQCGECTVCCSALQVDQPEFKKPAGEMCGFCAAGQGCTIYETRFNVCRGWFCGYRSLDWIDATLRPDRAGVLIFHGKGQVSEGFDEALSLNFMILDPGALRSTKVIAAMCRSIAEGRATKMVLPAPPGGMPNSTLLNELVQNIWSDRWPALLMKELKTIQLAFRFASQTYPGVP